MSRLEHLQERLRLSLWFVPGVFAIAAVLLAFGLVAVDRALKDEPAYVLGGTAEGARNVLSTIAQSMLTFTGLVFTVTMLVLQLASSQLSPRVMRTFLRDRGNQVVLGLFVATFVFTLLVLREVRSEAEGVTRFVPGFAVWAAFVLLLGSVAAFIWYIDHMAHSIRASTVIQSIWRETVDAIDRMYPADWDPARAGLEEPDLRRPDAVIESRHAGVIVGVDTDALLSLAKERDGVLAIVHPIGDFVVDGGAVAIGSGRWDDEASDAVLDAISIAGERTMNQDVAFGIRQLVDVAVRALSPGTNDPTTAVQVLDRIDDILRRLVGRPYPSAVKTLDGEVRLVVPTPSFEDHLSLGLDEIALAGRDQIQIKARLDTLLDGLESVASPGRIDAVRRRRRALSAASS